MSERRLRVAAYGLCVEGDQVLLAHFVSIDQTTRHWTLPGGGIEHGEDPYDTVVREVAEETGYQVRVDRLLGVDSRTMTIDWGIPGGAELHSIACYYSVRRVGGELRNEVGGSTDQAAWVPLDQVATLPRASLVEVGLDLYRRMPPDGRGAQVPVGGLIRP